MQINVKHYHIIRLIEILESTKIGKATSSKGGLAAFGGKLFAGSKGFDPVTIIMQIASM